MKTIEVSDEDYETLMELSKELQTQDNVGQAWPYFWEPRSGRKVVNIHGEGEILSFVYDGEEYTPEEYFDQYEDTRKEFLREKDLDMKTPYSDIIDEDWIEFVKDNTYDVDVWTEDWERKSEHNPSFFYSDVENFCERNGHHLGVDPAPYARTIWRMPKMEALAGAVARLNKNHGEEINQEAKRFVLMESVK